VLAFLVTGVLGLWLVRKVREDEDKDKDDSNEDEAFA